MSNELKELNEKFRDFKGQHLCKKCWNGNHFTRDEVTKKLINCCMFGDCECPCSRMQQNRADDNYRIKQALKESQKRQTEIPMDNCISVGLPTFRSEK
jgi:hypothetical protein